MLFVLLLTISLFITSIFGAFVPETTVKHLQPRTYFPDTPASCPVCQKNYDNINSCAQAAPVLANFTYVIFNPGAFIDVIKCACTDTFQSAFPQCVDCFEKTNQTQWLDTPDLPSVVQGVRNVCALASTLISNVSASASAAEASAASAATAATSPSASTSSNDALQSLNTRLAGAVLAITIAIATLSF